MNERLSFIALVSFHGISGTSFVPIIPRSLTYVLTQILTDVLILSITYVLKPDTKADGLSDRHAKASLV
jgi:hypothetical protein